MRRKLLLRLLQDLELFGDVLCHKKYPHALMRYIKGTVRGQIRSDHSKGLLFSSSAAMFLKIYFDLEFLKGVQNSKQLNSKIRVMGRACLEIFSLIGWCIYFTKKSAKLLHKPSSKPFFWETPNRPVNIKYMTPAFF